MGKGFMTEDTTALRSDPTSRTHPVLSIVIPTYQEAENLGALVEGITAAISELNIPYEIIIVDDDSRDGSSDIAAGLSEQGHPVRMITRVGERGLSSAVLRGFDEAEGDILLCMDGDLSHPPEAIPDILKYLEEPEVEFVIGSRYVPGGSTEKKWGLFRWMNSKVATLLARPFTSAKDPMAGFFALRRSVYERADTLSPVGYKIGLELIVKCRCRNIREVPIHFADRKLGQSKLNLKEQVNYLRHLKRLADVKYGAFSRFGQFCVVGTSGAVVDLFTYWVLLSLTVPIMLARAMAIWVAMTWNFWLNRRFTFSYSRRWNAFSQYFRFVATCLLGAVISWSVAMGLTELSGFFKGHVFLAAVCGILVGTICNFLSSLKWVFRRREPART